MEVRKANMLDIKRIAEIERICFPPAEAASFSSFEKRMDAFLECFLVIEEKKQIIGFIDGMVIDEEKITDILFEDASLHKKDGAWQSVFSLAVLPEYTKRGVGAILMEHFIEMARNDGRKGCILTCKDHLVHYYSKFGYEKLGRSESVHGGAIWYDMLLAFPNTLP